MGNLAVSLMQVVIITGWIVDILLTEDKKSKNESEKITSGKMYICFFAVVLLVFAMDVLLNYGMALDKRINATWKYSEMVDMAAVIDRSLPEDIKAIGTGVQELYKEMGRETDIYSTDWSDMNDPTLERIKEILEGEKSFFAEKTAAEQLQLNYYPIAEWVYVGKEYAYYSKDPNETLSARFEVNRFLNLIGNICDDEITWEALEELTQTKQYSEIYHQYISEYVEEIDNADYIEMLYDSLLARPSSEEEVRNLCERLDNNEMTKEQIYNMVCYSEEFNNLKY